MNIVLGVDIGGTEVKYGLFSEDGELLDKWSSKTDLGDAGARIIPSIAENIRSYFLDHQIEESDLRGIGMGIPGPIDDSGYAIKCVDLHWSGFYPAKELGRFFPDAYVAAGNDANMAAMGEYTKGAGKKYNSMMMITLGTGVGGGIIINGNVISGAHGNAGEIGHIAVGPEETEVCNCGNVGCIDQFASATGIVRIMKRLLGNNQIQLTAKDICEMAEAGDETALKCLNICMSALGKGMAFFTHSFEPEAFIIGGGVSKSSDLIIPIIKRYYEEQLHLIEQGAEIVPAVLGNDAGIIGAASLAMKGINGR